MTAQEIMKELEKMGDEQTKKILLKHGAKEPFFGVKVADLKTILKKTKKNHELSLELYATGNSDAMYLAGLMADEKKISEAQLKDWIEKAYWFYLNEFTVPWVAAESPYGFKLGLEWIESKNEKIAAAGWSTLAYYAGVHPDSELNIAKYRELIEHISKNIHDAPNRVKYTMNGFIIAVGTYIKELTELSAKSAQKIGIVSVDMNGTACKVPLASEYLQKNIEKEQVGKKRKTARC